jgi:hypothetical protein
MRKIPKLLMEKVMITPHRVFTMRIWVATMYILRFVFAHGFANGDLRPVHPVPAVLEGLKEASSGRAAVAINIVQPGGVLGGGFVQPGFQELIVSRRCVEPLMGNFLSGG